MSWNSFEVVGSIEIRGTVDIACASPLQELEVRVRRNVLRVLKHHVLEQMGETSASRFFIDWPNVIPNIDRNARQPMVLNQQYIEPKEARYLSDGDRVAFGDAHFVYYTPGGFYDLLRSLSALL